MKKYTVELTEREILLLNSWLNAIKEEKPNYYNKYTHTVFDIFGIKADEIFENTRKKYNELKFQMEYESRWMGDKK